MEVLRIEPSESRELGPCPDCGSTTRSIWGYVYKNNDAHAMYYARWTDNHLERGIQILLSIGRWGDGTTGKMRRRVGVDCRMGSDRPSFMIIDASKMPWDNEKLLGKPLTKDEVLKDRIKDDAFDILDRLVIDDHRLRDSLLSGRHS